MKYTNFNASFRQSVLAVAQEMGLIFISSKRQVNNGTLMFHDPETDVEYGLYETGYIRRHIRGYRHPFMQKAPTYMYPLNHRSSCTVKGPNYSYRQNGEYELAQPNEQLGIMVRAVMNYRKK